MAAVRELPQGPSLRLLRLRCGVSQRAIARALNRRPARIAAVENSVVVSRDLALAYTQACYDIVREREALTLDDLR